MADQDAQDINQMMSASVDAVIKPPKKSPLLWIVLGCMVVGVGLGIFVYQQSIVEPETTVPTPAPRVATPVPTITPTLAPVVPETNVVQPLSNTITFPEAGKLRVFSSLSNLQLLLTVTIGGVAKTITLPARPATTSTMNYTDSTFEVTAGSTGSVVAHLNNASGPKMGGWILPVTDSKCGVTTFMPITTMLANAQTKVPTGKTIFAKQCWADEIVPSDPSSYDFNDFFLAWSYAGAVSSASPSPSSSATTTASPTASTTATASPSPTPTKSPSPTPTPSTISDEEEEEASPRVAMPDTSDGVPMTGVFEVTVGTVSLGLVLLGLGLFGLLAL